MRQRELIIRLFEQFLMIFLFNFMLTMMLASVWVQYCIGGVASTCSMGRIGHLPDTEFVSALRKMAACFSLIWG